MCIAHASLEVFLFKQMLIVFDDVYRCKISELKKKKFLSCFKSKTTFLFSIHMIELIEFVFVFLSLKTRKAFRSKNKNIHNENLSRTKKASNMYICDNNPI